MKTTPHVGARPSTRSSPKIACSTNPGASTVAATRSSAWRVRSRLLTLTFDISQLPRRKNWAMAGGSDGYQAALVRRRLTRGLISFHHCPGRPDCRRLSVFRQATLSWTLPCHGTAKEWNAHSEGSSWESGVDRLVGFSRSARQSERTFEHDRSNFTATF